MHEHLEMFSLINMNGRLYDPVLGRMLSPDNYIQEPDNTQSYNRYSYCINNPLKYTDPSGEIFGTILTGVIDFVVKGFFEGGFDPTSSSARNQAWTAYDPSAKWSKTNKAAKIDWGMFQTDPNRPWYERIGQLALRFTWEAPQSGLGNAFSHIRNNLGEVHNVDYWGGATIVNSDHKNDSRWGLTLGSYINSNRMKASPEDGLFRHEYGHVLQSRIAGPSYLTGIGIPSLIGGGLEMAFGEDFHNHNTEWYETNANQLAYSYFSRNESEALNKNSWDFNEYPIDYKPTLYWLIGNPIGSPWTYIFGLFNKK
jgi:RHS repeat-associated protein